MAWSATVLTIFPEMFPGPLGASLAGRALDRGVWALDAVDLRAFAHDRHGTVDDAPFGGGPGLVMRPDVAAAALDHARALLGESGDGARPAVYLTPRGRPFDQARCRELAAGPGAILLCGRYEGVDARVIEAREVEEISLGDFVLSGGELAAMCLVDACVRLLPGVMGAEESLVEESFSAGLLEYPQYTRPQVWDGRAVHEVLTSGHHERVRAWRQAQSEDITKARRPDLWDRYLSVRAIAADREGKG
ncbi:MAG: tRNA (guanosine(37)-N1)-methyltransferase TrmD [Alphaproteobacteria bacterium]